MKFCIKCGMEITEIADFCPSCGANQRQTVETKNREKHISNNSNTSKTMWQSVKEFYSINSTSKVMSRSTFWKAVLFNFIIMMIYGFAAALLMYWGRQEYYYQSVADLHRVQAIYAACYWSFRIVGSIGGLIMTIFHINSVVRRLHDTARSGWLWLLSFIPIINILLLVYLIDLSVNVDNKYLNN
jgi:uncharacterized membrane protein YhaH (DUF805 family)